MRYAVRGPRHVCGILGACEDYYETLGQTGYRLAAEDPYARRHSLNGLYDLAADAFGPVRRALNTFSDGYLLPRPASPVDRVLRQAANDYQDHTD